MTEQNTNDKPIPNPLLANLVINHHTTTYPAYQSVNNTHCNTHSHDSLATNKSAC